MSTTPRRVVYTAMIGGHEELQEQPLAAASAVEFICLTDDVDMRSDTWDIRVVDPLLPLDPIRSARALKITGYAEHADFASVSESLWIDARVVLDRDPAEILDAWLAESDLAVPRHSFRRNVVTEFDEVLLAGLDDPTRLYEQLTHYATLAPGLLEANVSWTGMLARRHTSSVRTGMNEWLLHVMRYSRRDQLSFVQAMDSCGVPFAQIDIGTYSSDVHRWMPPRGRSKRPPIFRVSESLRAPVAQIGELQHQLEVTTREMVTAVTAREERITALEAQVSELTDRVARKDTRITRLRGKVQDLERAGAQPRSAPTPIRRLRSKLKRVLRRKG